MDTETQGNHGKWAGAAMGIQEFRKPGEKAPGVLGNVEREVEGDGAKGLDAGEREVRVWIRGDCMAV